MIEHSAITTFLFTDIESSTQLWENDPERMAPALARHDRILREAVVRNHGVVVKSTGDGMHAAFDDPRDALVATLEFQMALDESLPDDVLTLRVRCGIHAGAIQRRDGDYFGSAVNRAARIMNAAHGGQVLLSLAVAHLLHNRLPDGASLLDLGAVRLRDLSGAEPVYQVQHARLRATFPALRSLEAVPNNLPQQVTTFIGREREQLEIKAVLAKSRLLTLTGIGGIGKTRLSLQVAADVVNDYPDGVWLVELAPIADGKLLQQAVASVLGVKDEPDRTLSEALVGYVRDRKLLLVLDNCEHVLPACAEVAKQLLQAGAKTRILCSSREQLNIAGESIYPVPSLSVPLPEAHVSVDSMLQFEAARFFAERATAIQPSFKLSELNAANVVEICRRLDGIPLALELAAARVRTLSVEQIASRVTDRFRLLTTGDRTAEPRQQTLRAMIDWSYDLLTDAEKLLLRRLAVFAGGWTLEAAEAVTAGGDCDETSVLDLLGELVDKSLVEVDATDGRYRLLETVRQYAHELLLASRDDEDTRARHLVYFLALAERARPELAGPHPGAWLARLDPERENLLAAHAWCLQSDAGGQPALGLANSMKLYLLNGGQFGLSYRLTTEALSHPDAAARDTVRCRGLFNAGQVCYFMGRYDEATDYLEESLAIAREQASPAQTEAALSLLGLSALGCGNFDAARRHIVEALALAREQGDKLEISVATNGLAQFHRLVGELDTAKPLYEEALALALELGDREFVAIAQLNLAMVAISLNSGDDARSLLRRVIAIAREVGSRPAGVSAIEVTAGLAASQRKWALAARLFGAAEAQATETGLRRDPADEAFLVPLIQKARDVLGNASFSAAEVAGRALKYDTAITESSNFLEQHIQDDQY
ncbi:MAG: tetratricopeptide repeat protein [Betaproteobacteria bacterium]